MPNNVPKAFIAVKQKQANHAANMLSNIYRKFFVEVLKTVARYAEWNLVF